MKIKEIKKEIKGVFKQPIKKYYFGKLKFGTPYFYPKNFVKSIIFIRLLKKRSESEIYLLINKNKYIYKKDKYNTKFTNFPIVTRNKYWVKKILGNYYYIEIGWPIIISENELGWKDKYNTPRVEWYPFFQINFFNLQFCIWWIYKNESDTDNYYEQILWWKFYSNKNIDKAKKTWTWKEVYNDKSTWNDNYLI